MLKIFSAVWVVLLLTSCSFNFELTSQKTALENQIMGSYKELDDEVLLMASVRGVNADGTKTEAKVQSNAAKLATDAKQNQSFNRDDVDELKEKQIVGEANTGELVVLPKGTGLAENASEDDLNFARYIIAQENRDRAVIVSRVVATNHNLAEKDTSAARSVYRKSLIEESPVGTWVQTEGGTWERKSADKGAKT